jgi:hypothetical protein
LGFIVERLRNLSWKGIATMSSRAVWRPRASTRVRCHAEELSAWTTRPAGARSLPAYARCGAITATRKRSTVSQPHLWIRRRAIYTPPCKPPAASATRLDERFPHQLPPMIPAIDKFFVDVW